MGFLAVAAVYGYIKQPMKALYVIYDARTHPNIDLDTH